MDHRISVLILLAFALQSLANSEFKSTTSSLQNIIKRRRTSRSVDCLRGINGACVGGIRLKRQTNCDRDRNRHCRIIGGRKREIQPSIDTLDCTSPKNSIKFLCKVIVYGRAMIRQCEGGDCNNPLLKRKDGKKEKQEEKCDRRSPFCFTTFPGKRIGKNERKIDIFSRISKKDMEGIVENNFNQETTRENDDDEEEETKKNCNPKRNYFCRYRPPGKRSKVVESTVKELLNKKWRAF